MTSFLAFCWQKCRLVEEEEFCRPEKPLKTKVWETLHCALRTTLKLAGSREEGDGKREKGAVCVTVFSPPPSNLKKSLPTSSPLLSLFPSAIKNPKVTCGGRRKKDEKSLRQKKPSSSFPILCLINCHCIPPPFKNKIRLLRFPNRRSNNPHGTPAQKLRRSIGVGITIWGAQRGRLCRWRKRRRVCQSGASNGGPTDRIVFFHPARVTASLPRYASLPPLSPPPQANRQKNTSEAKLRVRTHRKEEKEGSGTKGEEERRNVLKVRQSRCPLRPSSDLC